jgi:DNA-binding transcriptional LysR family regulator
MELHQIRYFLALAATLNFTRAAEQCNVTQPALTRAIQKLEHELGGDLVYRERHLTQLTDLGKAVHPMLEKTMAAAEATRVQAKEFAQKKIAPLRLGLSPTISASIMIESLLDLARLIPGLEVEILELSASQMAEALLNGEVHACVADTIEPQNERIDYLPLFDESFVTIVPRSHPFAALAAVPVALVQDAIWLEQVGCDVNDQFRRACFSPGSGPKVRHRGQQGSHLQHMAAAGLGVMLSAERTPRLPSLVARPIEGNPVRRKVQLLVMAGRRHSSVLMVFINIVRIRDWPMTFDRARLTHAS